MIEASSHSISEQPTQDLPSYTDSNEDYSTDTDSSEDCPNYSCSVTLSATMHMKRELSNPRTPAPNRSWKRVHVELRGTILLIRTIMRTSFRAKHGHASPPPYQRCESPPYTLQGGEAGVAADYKIRPFVIRVRAEAEQFLLAADTLAMMLEWTDKLNAAIAISLPLESRMEPKYRTLPPSVRPVVGTLSGRAPARHPAYAPPRSSARHPSQTPASFRNDLCRIWTTCISVIRTQKSWTHWTKPRQDSSTVRTSSRSSSISLLIDPQSICPCSTCSQPTAPTSAFSGAPSLSAGTLACTADTIARKSESKDGKWNPPHGDLSSYARLENARRCAKIVRSSSPREYDVLVSEDGKVAIRGSRNRPVHLYSAV